MAEFPNNHSPLHLTMERKLLCFLDGNTFKALPAQATDDQTMAQKFCPIS